MRSCYFCIDIGGTKTAYAVYDETGTELFYGQFPTQPERGADDLLERVYRATEEVRGIYAERLICGVIASPGPLDIPNGRIVEIATMGWKNLPLVSLFERKFGFKFYLLNDCNAGALGVYELYAKSKNSVVYVSVSTGIGGGFVIDGKLYNGKGNAAEIGHLPVAGMGLTCGCGKKDCLELYASGTGISHRYTCLTGENLSAEGIANRARKGEKNALSVFRDAGEKLGFALRSVVGMVDPEIIVLGGSVCKGKELFFPIAQSYIGNTKTEFVKGEGKQVIYGAYVYAKQTVNNV